MLLAAVLLMVPIVGVLQFHLLERASEAEAARLRRTASTAARQIRTEIVYDLSSLASLVSSWGVTQEPVGTLADAYGAWAVRARFPGLVERIVIVHGGDDGELEFRSTSGEQAPVPVSAPSWLRVETTGTMRDRVVLATDDPLVFRAPLLRVTRTEGANSFIQIHPTEGVIAAFIQLDERVLAGSVVPVLVAEYLGDDPQGFQAALFAPRSREILYATVPVTAEELWAGAGPDEVLQLLGSSAGEPPSAFDAAGPNTIVQHWLTLRAIGERAAAWSAVRDIPRPDGRAFGWERESLAADGPVLLIWHAAGSIERAVAAGRNRSLLVTGVFLAGFSGVAVLFHALYLQSLRQRAREHEFVVSVTHELRTPVAAMHAVAENLAEGIVSDAARVREYGAALLEEGRRLRAMIDQTLAYAGLHAEPRRVEREIDLDRLVQRSIATTGELASDQVAVEIDPRLAGYRGDEVSLGSILTNLLSNAAKHNPPGTRVTLSLAAHSGRRGIELVLIVADDGTGIPRSELRRVKEAFFRGAASQNQQVPGTGLGLSIVERLVAGRRGTMRIESRVGAGTRVMVRLPCEA